jgi:hypothetical protein
MCNSIRCHTQRWPTCLPTGDFIGEAVGQAAAPRLSDDLIVGFQRAVLVLIYEGDEQVRPTQWTVDSDACLAGSRSVVDRRDDRFVIDLDFNRSDESPLPAPVDVRHGRVHSLRGKVKANSEHRYNVQA